MVATKKFTPIEGINHISSHSFSIVLKRLKIPGYQSKIEEIPHTLHYDSCDNIYMCIDLTCDSDEEKSVEIVDIISNHVSDLIVDDNAPSPISRASPPYGPYESDDEGVDMYDISSAAAPDVDKSVTDEPESSDVGGNANQYEASSISDCKIKISRKKEGITNVADSGTVAITTSVHDKLCALFKALNFPSASTIASKPCKKRVSHFVRSNKDRESEVVERLRTKLHSVHRARPKKCNEKRKMLKKISTNKVAGYHQSNNKKESPSLPLSSIPNVNGDSKDSAPPTVSNEKVVDLVSEALLSSIKASDKKDKEVIANPKSSITEVEFPVEDENIEKEPIPSLCTTSTPPPVCMKWSLEALDLAVPVQKKMVKFTEGSAGNSASTNEKLLINSNANSCAVITNQNKLIHTAVIPKVAESSAPVEPLKSHIGTIRVVPLDQLRDPALLVPPPNTTNVAPNVTVLPTAGMESMLKEIVSSTPPKSRSPRKSYKRKLPITNRFAPIKSRKKCDTTETLFIPSNPQNVLQSGGVELKSSPVSQVVESHLNNRSPSSTYGPWPVSNYGAQQPANHSRHKNVDSQVLPPMYLHQTRHVSQPSPVQRGFSQPSFSSQVHLPVTQTQNHQATFNHTPGYHQATFPQLHGDQVTFTQTQIHQPTLPRAQPFLPYPGNVPTSMVQQQYLTPCQGFQQQQQQPFVENCSVSFQNPVAAPQLYNQQLPSHSVGYPNGFSPPVANTAPLMNGCNCSQTAAVYQHYCSGLSVPQQYIYESANSSVMDESDLIQQITNRGIQDFLKALQ